MTNLSLVKTLSLEKYYKKNIENESKSLIDKQLKISK
jgi:hypothetical protein